ncbi:Transcription elongation protein nusA [Sphingomonas paucimobilis]|nr:Transcription elongation protein nusA [Sphingomonas paucimobilis]
MVNALQPANVSRVVIDEEEDRIEVVVPDDQLSLAIGRRGQNVRLASQLTAKAIDILTEADASEKRQKEFVANSEMFQNELDVDETLRSCWSPRASARWKRSPMSSSTSWPRSRASTRTWRKSCRAGRRKRWTAANRLPATSVVRWASRTRWPRCRT